MPAEAIPGFIAALRSSDPDVVRLAIANLSAYDHKAGRAAPELARKLRQMLDVKSPNPDSPERASRDLVLASVDCLRLVARDAAEQKEAVAALSKALQTDREPPLRIAAAKALGQFRPDPALFAALTQYIGDRDPKVRHAVIWAIHDVDFAKGYIVPKALALALEDPSAETRVNAAAAICHSGLGADPFVPALVDHALQDPVPEVRSMCADRPQHAPRGEDHGVIRAAPDQRARRHRSSPARKPLPGPRPIRARCGAGHSARSSGG